MQYPLSQQKHGRRGTSLIEVLVVLVILVVGVLAISRLFPAGFLSLRTAENSSYASRLAQGTLDVLRQDNAALADGIYMYRADTQQFDPNYAPDNLKALTPGTVTAYDDINKARYISNETVTVPAAQGNVQASLHIVNFGPFEPGTLTANGTLWTATNGDSRLNPSGLVGGASLDIPGDQLQNGQQAFLVDKDAGQIAVPPAAYPQTFVLTVTKKIAGTQSVTFTVPASSATPSYSGTWFKMMGSVNLPDVGTVTTPDSWQTAELYRPFRQLASTTYSADPYEYALYNPSGGPVGVSTVAFNPLAGGRAGVQPLQARLSYSTQDWHILHEDRDVPSGGGTIRLALSNLKKVGDTQFDQTLFNGLGGSAFDIYLLDRDTGAFTGLIGNGASENVTNLDDNSAPTTPIASVSYSNGRITLPAAFSGKHLRVFYAGVADWAVAVEKAPKSYKVNVIATATSTTYVTNPGTNTPNRCQLDLSTKRIAFPVCDAGKMVQITIGTQPPLTVNIPDTLGSGVQYVDVSSILPTTTPVPAVTVTGLSARAYVIWHERDNWKQRSIDTLLTRLD